MSVKITKFFSSQEFLKYVLNGGFYENLPSKFFFFPLVLGVLFLFFFCFFCLQNNLLYVYCNRFVTFEFCTLSRSKLSLTFYALKSVKSSVNCTYRSFGCFLFLKCFLEVVLLICFFFNFVTNFAKRNSFLNSIFLRQEGNPCPFS